MFFVLIVIESFIGLKMSMSRNYAGSSPACPTEVIKMTKHDVDEIIEDIRSLFDDNGYVLDGKQELMIKYAILDRLEAGQ